MDPRWLLVHGGSLVAVAVAIAGAVGAVFAAWLARRHAGKTQVGRLASGRDADTLARAAVGERLTLRGRLRVEGAPCARFDDGAPAAATSAGAPLATTGATEQPLEPTLADARAERLVLVTSAGEVALFGRVAVLVGSRERRVAVRGAVRERLERVDGPFHLSSATVRSVAEGDEVVVAGVVFLESAVGLTTYRRNAKTLVLRDVVIAGRARRTVPISAALAGAAIAAATFLAVGPALARATLTSASPSGLAVLASLPSERETAFARFHAALATRRALPRAELDQAVELDVAAGEVDRAVDLLRERSKRTRAAELAERESRFDLAARARAELGDFAKASRDWDAADKAPPRRSDARLAHLLAGLKWKLHAGELAGSAAIARRLDELLPPSSRDSSFACLAFVLDAKRGVSAPPSAHPSGWCRALEGAKRGNKMRYAVAFTESVSIDGGRLVEGAPPLE